MSSQVEKIYYPDALIDPRPDFRGVLFRFGAGSEHINYELDLRGNNIIATFSTDASAEEAEETYREAFGRSDFDKRVAAWERELSAIERKTGL